MDSQEADKLCEFLHKATHVNPHRKPGQQLVDLVQSIFDVDAVAILDLDLKEIYRTGDWFDDVEEILKTISLFETASEDRETGLIRRVLRVGQLPIGAMLVRGGNTAQAADAIAAIVSITFDRYHAFASESRSESARQTEQMRTMVLDSLAHAYKTPLTAIEAAGTGLAAMGNLTVPQSELVKLIEEQADFLKQLTNRLLRTARLQASDLVLQNERVAVGPLVDDVLASLREPLARFSVAIVLSSEEIAINGDRGLLTALLTQYLDNASKYAQAGTKITIEGVEKRDSVILSVRSTGPVIPPGDHGRIFDRYFRSSHSHGQAPGTGIGLSVAKQAAQAHGGHVWVTSTEAGVTTFYASFPDVNDHGEIQ